MYIYLKRNFDFTLSIPHLTRSPHFSCISSESCSTLPTTSDLFRAGKTTPAFRYRLFLLVRLAFLLLLLLTCHPVQPPSLSSIIYSSWPVRLMSFSMGWERMQDLPFSAER